MESTQVCIVDESGRKLVSEKVESAPDAIATALRRVGAIERAVIETGRMSPAICLGLRELGVNVVCIDARQAHQSLKAMNLSALTGQVHKHYASRTNAQLRANLWSLSANSRGYFNPRPASSAGPAASGRSSGSLKLVPRHRHVRAICRLDHDGAHSEEGITGQRRFPYIEDLVRNVGLDREDRIRSEFDALITGDTCAMTGQCYDHLFAVVLMDRRRAAGLDALHPDFTLRQPIGGAGQGLMLQAWNVQHGDLIDSDDLHDRLAPSKFMAAPEREHIYHPASVAPPISIHLHWFTKP